MRRGFWFSAGVAAGVYGMVRVRRVAEAFTPDGIRDRVKAAGLGARMLRDELVQGTADAEDGLRERYGLPPAHQAAPAHPALEAAPVARRALSAAHQHEKHEHNEQNEKDVR